MSTIYDVPDVPILYIYTSTYTIITFGTPPISFPNFETEASGKGGLGGSTRGAGTQ